ncbi:MAG: hypothetical protein ACFFB3_12020 [Candidatus Hodarchaeota archaeon]
MNFNRNRYEELPLYMSMAGRGNPWGALTTRRKQLMRALHDKLPLSELEGVFGLSTAEIRSEITPLVEVHLVEEVNGRYQPAFLIVNSMETQRIIDHASQVGRGLASHLWNRWDDLEAHYRHLTISKSHSFQALAFLLVGGRLLDIGLLEVLAKDRTLLLPAPSRPSLDRPDAQYYFWMIEGDLAWLGKYGQEDISLPWSNWRFLTFGQNFIDGKFNDARQAMEDKCGELLEKKLADNPRSLSEQLNVPLIDPKDTEYWLKIVESHAKELFLIYKDAEEDLRELYGTLEASGHSSDYFGEFFCWHVHFAYACAIDDLLVKGAMELPSQHFTAALWHREQQEEGLLIYF